MSFNSADTFDDARQQFCNALKAARESKGIGLAEISDVTKIPASLFESLERTDLRLWPKGFFKRSFFRDYVRTIGLPVAEACAEFARLFPDDDAPEVTAATPAPSDTATPFVLPDRFRGTRIEEVIAARSASWKQRLDNFSASWRQRVDAISRVLVSVGVGSVEQTVEPARTWISDARRVVSTPPRIRVRIKVPK